MNKLLIALICIVTVGCTSNNADRETVNEAQSLVTPSAIPTFTPIPTDTPFPTNTPAPSPTSLPQRLDILPEYNVNDVVVIAGAYVFQIMGVDMRDQIGNSTPNEGNQFLVIDGILYNYTDADQSFFRTDFELVQANQDSILPNVERMEDLQDSDIGYSETNFPARSVIRLNVLNIPAHQWKSTFLVYEVPEDISEITLNFSPANISPPSAMGLWIVEDIDSNEIDIYKAYDNGIALYSIDFEFTNRRVQLEELIDEELIEVDNCFGNATVTRTFTFREEIETSYNIGTSVATAGLDVAGSAAGALMGNPIIGQILTTGFTGFFDIEESEVIEVTREEQLSAAPNTMTRYQLSWYRVTLQGTLQMQVGGENFYVPYTITDRLRSSLVSLTPGICETDN